MATRSQTTKRKSVSKRKEDKNDGMESGLPEKCPRECRTRHSKGGVCFKTKYPFKTPSSTLTSGTSTTSVGMGCSSNDNRKVVKKSGDSITELTEDTEAIPDDLKLEVEADELSISSDSEVDLEIEDHNDDSEQPLAMNKAASPRLAQ